jgi:ABC-type bacteriocin/lantibiotic exporter with double-glycine peptidase domain
MKKINFINVIKKIFDNLSLNKKIIIGIFFIFSLFSAFAETASISSVIPFMDLMIDPNKLSFYLDKLNIEINLELFTTNQMLILITLIFITIIFLATLLKILLGYIGTKISVSVTHEMNTLVFSQVVNSDYLTDNKNDENNINASIYQVNSVTVFLEQFLSIISNLIILSFVLLLVISLTDQKVIYASLIFFSLYFLITFITKRILFKNSELLAKNYNSRVVHLNNTIALFKNIKVDFLEKYFFVYFKKIDYQIAKSSLINTIAVSIPGTLMISFAIIIFSILILITNLYEYNLIEQIPIYAALVFGTQKMLPMMQNIYGAIAKMRANSFQALIALELISKNKIKLKKKYHIDFEKSIHFKEISYKYPASKELILKNLNFEMNIGDRILISGPSGAGKTTFLNLLLGLLKPLRGEILVDRKKINEKYHKSLRNLYSYIPQNIFIFNGTYKENISLSLKAKKIINKQRAVESAKIAMIDSHIRSSKKKYETIISHKGRNISGGQIQRLGIARGLYKDSKIIIFDESTNAIDRNNESKIYKNLNRKYKDKIFIFVSHKKINDNFFNKEYSLINKRLIRKK